jgi:hypothetical protein
MPGSLMRTLMAMLRPGHLPARRADPAVFGAFLGTRAAFVAQKTVLDYCAVKLGVNWPKAQAEADFMAVLDACRWAVFYPSFVDLSLAAGRWLLAHARHPSRLAEGLGQIALAALEEQAAAGQPAAIADTAQLVRMRLLALPEAPPPGPASMRLSAARVLLETLPIHPDLRRGENPAILGGLRMNFVAATEDMERRFDAAPLAAALEAAAGPRTAA